jgi:hypothetical protein
MSISLLHARGSCDCAEQCITFRTLQDMNRGTLYGITPLWNHILMLPFEPEIAPEIVGKQVLVPNVSQ